MLKYITECLALNVDKQDNSWTIKTIENNFSSIIPKTIVFKPISNTQKKLNREVEISSNWQTNKGCGVVVSTHSSLNRGLGCEPLYGVAFVREFFTFTMGLPGVNPNLVEPQYGYRTRSGKPKKALTDSAKILCKVVDNCD